MRRCMAFAPTFIFALFFIAGCAVNTRASSQNSFKNEADQTFSGRISLVIEADPSSANPTSAQAAQSFSGSFEWLGDAQQGQLDLLSPLGQIVAQLDWQPGAARLTSGVQTRLFASAQAMIEQATGAALSPDMLVSWLRGQEPSSAQAGPAAPQADATTPTPSLWQADLSRYHQGRIVAKRIAPAPSAVLTIALDRP